MLPISREQAFVLLALHTLRRPCSRSLLETLYGHGKKSLAGTLETLRQRNMVTRHGGSETLWESNSLPGIEMDLLAENVRVPISERDTSHLIGYIYSTDFLDHCEYVLKYMTDEISSGELTTMNLYVEMVINFLIVWAERRGKEAGSDNWKFMNLVLVVQCFSVYSQSNLRQALTLGAKAEAVASVGGNTRLKPFLVALRLYLISLSRYPAQDELEELAKQVEEADRQSDSALDKLMPWLRGVYHFMRGEFQQVVDWHQRNHEQPHWWYRRLFSLQALNTLYAANYLGLYHLAAGICESAKNTAFLGGESAVSQVYLLQHCFLLLRIQETEKMRKGIEQVMHSSGYDTSYVLRSLCARVMALHHYIEGSVHTAYSFLQSEVQQAMERGMSVSPFHDPLVLDMLYVFEQKGYAPIPHYTLDIILDPLQHSANTHLRGVALRIQALRERDCGMAPEQVVVLLRESLKQLVPSGDPRELALTIHALAQALEQAGQKEEVRRLQQILSQGGNNVLESADYREASILCLGVSPSFVACVPHYNAASVLLQRVRPHSGKDMFIRCHKAFHRLPVHENLDGMCLALAKIAQTELDAEQAALFTLDENRHLVCKGAVNLTSAELKSEQMRPRLRWLHLLLEENVTASRVHHEFGLCLVLDVGDAPWILTTCNHITEGLAKFFTQDELQDLGRLFAAELRSCLRIDSVRDRVISNQYARLKTIVSLHEEGAVPPLLGHGMQTLMRKALQVSTTDAPILLWGETGVGKEVLARQIHDLSGCPGPFIAIHPASMPETLFESECFGYERGAFTGAVKQKIGLFELADRGTLFIDEIGEISQLIQTKLLRVLQEKRFMRVGGTHEIASRFRLVTATNRDIWKEVLEGRFRQDLLYRISVVPLKIPALRERAQDIPPLARMFAEHFCRRHGKTIPSLTATQIEQLCSYTWPGNIRELRNVMERAVILTDPGEDLHLELINARSSVTEHLTESVLDPILELCNTTCNDAEKLFRTLPTLKNIEEQYLRHVLHLTNGHVLGSDGAAALLCIKHTTLYAKLRKYGIRSASIHTPARGRRG